MSFIPSIGCVLLPLPAYSPDFNPIEKVFHQGMSAISLERYLTVRVVKAGLRRKFMEAVEGEEALEAIFHQLGLVTPAQAVRYYRDCGFNTGKM
jgi:hypothetical protein